MGAVGLLARASYAMARRVLLASNLEGGQNLSLVALEAFLPI